MNHKHLAAFLLALAGAAPTAWAGECETNFSKSGSILTGTDFSSSITVPTCPWPTPWVRCAAS